MKNRDKKLTSILVVSIFLFIGTIIAYPIFKIYNVNKSKEKFKGTVSNIITEAKEYYLEHNKELNENKIFTIEDGKIVEEGLDYNGTLPNKGTIIINKNGEIQIVVNNSLWCATKKYNELDINVSDYSSDCEVNNVVSVGNINVTIVNSGDGLYEENGSFYYKGLNPNNYILVNDTMFRIISLDEQGNLKLISNDILYSEFWSEKEESLKYEVVNSDSIGYRLNNLDINDNIEKLIKNKDILEYTWSQEQFNYNQNETISSLKENRKMKYEFVGTIGLISVEDYVKASLNSNCKNNILRNINCGESNYLNIEENYYTLSISNDSIWSINNDGKVYESSLDLKNGVRLCVYVDKNIKLQGKGTKENPYVIVTK